MPSEDGEEQVVVQVSVAVVNKGRKDDRRYHQEKDLENFTVGFFTVMCVFGSFPQNYFPVYAVNDQHKAEACQDTGSCSEGSAGGTEFGMFGIVCRELLDEEPGGANTECGVEYLLDDL